jgi:hypothetical protein
MFMTVDASLNKRFHHFDEISVEGISGQLVAVLITFLSKAALSVMKNRCELCQVKCIVEVFVETLSIIVRSGVASGRLWTWHAIGFAANLLIIP